MNFVAMDFETANAKRYSAVSMGLVIVRNDIIVDEFYTLIKPDTYFDRRNTAIHGIHESDVQDAPTFPMVWEQINQFFTPNQLIVAHNASFDNSVLRETLAYYGKPAPHYLALDTLRTSRKLYPDLVNHKLNTLAAALQIDLNHHHNALDDTVAAAKILITQAKQFGVSPLKQFVKVI